MLERTCAIWGNFQNPVRPLHPSLMNAGSPTSWQKGGGGWEPGPSVYPHERFGALSCRCTKPGHAAPISGWPSERTEGPPMDSTAGSLATCIGFERSLFGFTLPHGAVRPAAFADSINNFDSSHTACVRYGCRGSGHSKFFNTVRVSVKEGSVSKTESRPLE